MCAAAGGYHLWVVSNLEEPRPQKLALEGLTEKPHCMAVIEPRPHPLRLRGGQQKPPSTRYAGPAELCCCCAMQAAWFHRDHMLRLTPMLAIMSQGLLYQALITSSRNSWDLECAQRSIRNQLSS